MSISSHLFEIRPRLLERLQREPLLVATVVYPELSDAGSSSDYDIDALIRSWSPARQQYARAVQSADVDAIGAALKKLVPRKQWQAMMAHCASMTKDQLLEDAAKARQRLIKVAGELKSIGAPAAQEEADVQPIADGDLGERVCIDKAWGGLHYLLCGGMDIGQEPSYLAVIGGREIGDDGGYGPARYLVASQVKAVANALSTFDHEALRKRYDAAAMNAAQVYPGRWDDPRAGDRLDWLLQAFDNVLDFYRGAAARSNVVIKHLR